MESNVEAIQQDADKVRQKYGDKDIPQAELKKFQVMLIKNFPLCIDFVEHVLVSSSLTIKVTFVLIISSRKITIHYLSVYTIAIFHCSLL